VEALIARAFGVYRTKEVLLLAALFLRFASFLLINASPLGGRVNYLLMGCKSHDESSIGKTKSRRLIYAKDDWRLGEKTGSMCDIGVV